VSDWIILDVAIATQAQIDVEAAIQAVREVAQQLPDGVLADLAQYLERAENALEYSLATISVDAGDEVKAHTSRARSAQRQLAGLRTLSEQILERMGRAFLADITKVLGAKN